MNNVIKIEKNDIEFVNNILRNESFEEKSTANGNIFRSKDIVISVYNSGKILFQGASAELWYDKLHRQLKSSNQNGDKKADNEVLTGGPSNKLQISNVWPRLGSDESGKGDFFGPIVTAAFLIVSPDIEHKLQVLGVQDSKNISNSKVTELAYKIKNLGPHSIVKIGPEKYNQLYSSFRNVNKLLAWSHARAIENVLEENDCELVVADQFGDESLIKKALFERGKNIQLCQMHKAEADLAVAAASVLARATFLHAIEKLSSQLGVNLPLGASEQTIDVASKIMREKGIDFLNRLAKIHFRTYDIVKKRI